MLGTEGEKWCPPQTCEQEERNHPEKWLVMLLHVKERLGHNSAELPSPRIRRHDGAIDKAESSLTLFADVKAESRDFVCDKYSNET